jgi:hypothetical protein
VKETFALRNSVFFNLGSTAIPARYVVLSKTGQPLLKKANCNKASQ